MKAATATAALALLAVAGGGIFWWLTAPERLSGEVLAAATAPGDAGRGERIFNAAGCTSCHSRPGGAPEARLELAGGLKLTTEFGTFVAPNISSDTTDGIGDWSAEDFANAMMRGVAPDGAHYYPAFPYTSYARMKPSDVADLHAYMTTLPAVQGAAPGHELSFPFTVRRGVGLWKRLYLDVSGAPVVALADASEAAKAGQYLVEGPGHCGECHTPRNAMGGPKTGAWLSGAVAAEGDGVVPNITPGEGGIADWSAGDIAYYLESGFTPDFDSAGGAMAAVQKNMALLPAEDREAIAAYLKAIPAHGNGYPPRQPAAQ